MNKVITVLSGKGGTGTTACAVNLAASIAKQGKNTILLDLHAGSGALDLVLGVQNQTIYHAGDVLRELCSIEEARVRVPGFRNLSLLAGDPSREEPEPERIGTLIRSCGMLYDAAVIDAGCGWDGMTQACASASDLTLLITTPDHVSLRALEQVEDRMIRARIMNRRYLVNRVIPSLIFKGIEPEVAEIDSRIRCGMAGMVLEDENIRSSMGVGVPVVSKTDSYISDNFSKITSRLLG